MIESHSATQDGSSGHPSLALRVGCTFAVDAPQPSVAIMQVAPSQQPGLTIRHESWYADGYHYTYVDHYLNRCERFELPAGPATITYDTELVVHQPADVILPDTRETPVDELPDQVLTYVMPSRFCLPDELGNDAWQRFGQVSPGWNRVQAICDYVHGYLQYTAGGSNPWTTAADAYRSGQGVCRDFAHLAITFCRALNIPARYVFGYIPDIGVAPPDEAMDFCAWFEAYLDGQWHTFDARNNIPRIGRVIVGRGRDAVDVALITSFGPLNLTGFKVVADPVDPAGPVGGVDPGTAIDPAA